MIDPSILSAAASMSAAVTRTGSRAAPPQGTGEPWADWVNLDGDGPTPLGLLYEIEWEGWEKELEVGTSFARGR